MTRLHHVKKAAKTIRGTGIKKGTSFYWWKFYGRPKQYSVTKPKRSAYATRSEFVAAMMDQEDWLEEADWDDAKEALETLQETLSVLEELREGEHDKLNAVMEKFPNGCPSAELLERRVECCESTMQTIQSAIDLLNEDGDEDDISNSMSLISWEYE